MRDRTRDLDRQVGGERGQDARLAVVQPLAPVVARQAQCELVAETVDDVDRPVARALDGQLRPVRELLHDELPDERVFDVELIRVNAHQPKP